MVFPTTAFPVAPGLTWTPATLFVVVELSTRLLLPGRSTPAQEQLSAWMLRRTMYEPVKTTQLLAPVTTGIVPEPYAPIDIGFARLPLSAICRLPLQETPRFRSSWSPGERMADDAFASVFHAEE